MRKHQLTQSTSNDLKKIAPSSDALNMHLLRAAHTARFEWVECLPNVSVPDPYVSTYHKFLPLMLLNFFKHVNAKQQSV